MFCGVFVIAVFSLCLRFHGFGASGKAALCRICGYKRSTIRNCRNLAAIFLCIVYPKPYSWLGDSGPPMNIEPCKLSNSIPLQVFIPLKKKNIRVSLAATMESIPKDTSMKLSTGISLPYRAQFYGDDRGLPTQTVRAFEPSVSTSKSFRIQDPKPHVLYSKP